MIKKIMIIAGVIILLVSLAAGLMLMTLVHNPGMYIKMMSEKIVENQVVEASYTYDFDNTSETKAVPSFYFIPSESGNYTFSAVDIESSAEVNVTMSAMDKELNDYFVADNRDHDTEGLKDTISDTTALQESQMCMLLFNVEPVDGDLTRFSGSFKVTVTKEADDEGPPQLTLDGPVTIKVDAEGQACASFIPPETGYYRFEHSIVSHDSSKGYSSLSSITSADKLKVGLTNGISMLMKGKEYYVWAIANETSSKESEIELSCVPMNTEKAKGICSVELSGESVIEYVADKDCNLAVYSVSAGDPKLIIYEQAGFPLRSDDTSEASLSDNPNDVATVLTVKKGAGLRICVFDNVTDCRVFITEYTGDGTTLTINDLVPIPEKKEFDDEADENTSEDANENTVEHADENADEEAEEETP